MRNFIAFERDLTRLINEHGLEKYSSTPDYLLAKFLVNCLRGYGTAMQSLVSWHGGNVPTPTDENAEALEEAVAVFKEFAASSDRAHDLLHDLVIGAGEDDASNITNQGEADELGYLVSLGWTAKDIIDGLRKENGEIVD